MEIPAEGRVGGRPHGLERRRFPLIYVPDYKNPEGAEKQYCRLAEDDQSRGDAERQNRRNRLGGDGAWRNNRQRKTFTGGLPIPAAVSSAPRKPKDRTVSFAECTVRSFFAGLRSWPARRRSSDGLCLGLVYEKAMPPSYGIELSRAMSLPFPLRFAE